MNKEKYIEWANESLGKGDYDRASEYYEKYAQSQTGIDIERSALYYSLAAQYEKTSLDKALILYKKARDMYRRSANLSACVDMSMAMAILYQDNGCEEKAIQEYSTSIINSCALLSNKMKFLKTCINQIELDDNMSQVEKITFCLKKLSC